MKIENIKFKAKRLDNGKWVEGYFYAECGNTYIIENRQEESMLNRNITYEVDTDTICQFTGLKDCKGKEIFEHDLKEDKPPLKKWVMFRYNGGGVKPTALHYGAMSDDLWIVTRGDGTQRIEALYECYDKIEWLDFDELK